MEPWQLSYPLYHLQVITKLAAIQGRILRTDSVNKPGCIHILLFIKGFNGITSKQDGKLHKVMQKAN